MRKMDFLLTNLFIINRVECMIVANDSTVKVYSLSLSLSLSLSRFLTFSAFG